MKCRGQDCLLGATTLIGRTATPKLRGNCYVFGLAPQLGIGGFANRPSKAQPGMKCFSDYIDLSKPPKHVRAEMIKRVECDNPGVVNYIEPPYTMNSCNMEIPKNKHLMACIFGKDDYHFLRRMLRKTVLKMKILLNDLNADQLAQLKNSNRKYVWVHQRGWSKGPSLTDAEGNIAWSPIPNTSSMKLFTRKPVMANYNYNHQLGPNYPYYAGMFLVHSRMATVASESNSNINIQNIKKELVKRDVPFYIKG